MTSLPLPRFVATESEIPDELLRDPSVPLSELLEGRVDSTPEPPGPWQELSQDLISGDLTPDHELAPALYERLRIDHRIATDPAVWRYATVFHARPYVFQRWARNGKVKLYRLMGEVRRNALARLWWLMETLSADGVRDEDTIRLALTGSERLKLWVNDFNSLQGRPWLARAVVQRLRSSNARPSDDEVDAFFKALGRLSNIVLLDRYESRPGTLLDLVDNDAVRAAAER